MKHTKRKIIIGALPTLGVVLTTTNAKADDISEKAGLIASPEIKAVPKGEQNFNATVSLTSSAGLGSGTLINEDTIVTVAHNFIHLEGSNPIKVANNVKKEGQVHTATLPDGTKVTFSNDDIKFWNREGFVNGFKNDLAVVKLKNKFTGKKAADITTSAKHLKPGDTIHVFGYPQGKLQPILNEKVQTVENYGANIMGIGYQGSHPGASGGGMYDDKGNLIGVHQNGVVNVRSGGITFSKEQLDWVTSIANNAEKPPVYLPDTRDDDDKDKVSFDLKDPKDTKDLHNWLRQQKDKLDFGKLDKKEFYGLVSDDGKTYGDIRKVISDWEKAELPKGTYKVRKLKIVDIPEDQRKGKKLAEEDPTISEIAGNSTRMESSPQGVVLEQIIDSESGKELQPMFYEDHDSLDEITPRYFDLDSFVALDQNRQELTKVSQDGLYRGEMLVPYGDNKLRLTYKTTQYIKIGTKPSITFDNNRKRVIMAQNQLILKDKEETPHTVIQNYDTKEHRYELDYTPYLIVKETPDMKIDQDPGLLKALDAIKGDSPDAQAARKKIQELMNIKTGRVFKVRSYEEDGSHGWRYFRTWTNDVNKLGGGGITRVPHVYYHELENNFKSSVDYIPDDNLNYGEAIPDQIAQEESGNVSHVLWTENEPDHDGGPIEPNTPDLTHSGYSSPTLYERYEGDDTVRSSEGNSVHSAYKLYSVHIGTKPQATEEVVEKHKTKYVKNPELIKLGINERVLKEGSNKKKITKKTYTLLKQSDERNKLEQFATINKIQTKGTILPTIENGGIKLDETITYTNLEDKIIEIAAPEDKREEETLNPRVIYQSDDKIDPGTKQTIQGKPGKKVTTTTYEVDPDTGKITEKKGEPEITPAVDTIIKVGTKPKVTTTPIASPIEYVLDKNKPRTSPNETKPGKAGSTVTTINYTVEQNTGDVIPGNPITETTPPTKTIITVGGRDDEETEVIPPEIEYVPDDTNPGETIPGKPGKKVTPITYTIDPNTGDVTPHKGETIITPPTKTIIKVSTKPKVVTEDIEPGTRYEADPSRDKGTPNVTIPGTKGKKVTTTTYTLDKATGKTIEHTDKPVITPPVDTIIKVGTKTKVITEIIEPGIEYVRDDNNTGEKIQGKPGKKVITVTYTVDPNTGNVSENTGKPEITPPINTIVKIGTKDDVINEPIEPEVIYEGDDTRDVNTPNVTIPGKQGKKTTLITYELEPGTGKRIEKRGTPRVTPPINTIVKVGTKPKVVTKVIEPEVIYEGDVTRDTNTPNVTIPGKKGFTSTTTTYTVDPKTGKLTEKTTEKNEAPGKTIVKVGSKPKVVTELIDPEVLYEGDDTQDINSPNVTIPGTKGTKTTTTTYTVDPKTGKLTEKTTESETKPGTTRIKVGTKPTVKRVTDPNGDVYEETTTYTVEPKTGKVTPHTTRKLISKAIPKDPNDGAKASNGIDENGNPIKPPVLEVPEYTGVIAGNGLDGEGNIIEPPVLEVPEYTGFIAGNGLDGEGNIIDPPVLEVPEYTGVIAGNGLDGEGNIIQPPVLEVPEYKTGPKEEPKTEKPTPKQDTKKKLPETGDNDPAYLASLAVLGIGLLRRKRQK